ncbi:bifunctional serine/threonine-protein kinase/ABC transporter substrate-binding protein [Plectonema radiosum NIES-515]|uniref:non-specific serine/threonine protein kinase n=1 Tax=Plectonema radiosum NIES-515 TaxID=2986073 RepID=A0ABT3B3W8_9CYAN|nr:bifunctional serine/threonine-protein kinase/ABC transporter substrate-binding protein [Plectonema radiosum]MCV3215670.1 bifunctional serine/threonine-protein kinase/ABC transporter substrate-binding protein [Plectonema radiosum NIES-515]
MKVYCTRPRHSTQRPHVNDIPDDYLTNDHIQQRYCHICGMPLILKNQYLPLEEKGSGGFGITFVVLDLNSPGDKLLDKKRRIIKQLHPKMPLSAELILKVERFFKQEAEVLEELKHNQIPRLYAFFELSVTAFSTNTAQKLFYLVQEYIEGNDLQKECATGKKYTESEIIEFLREMLDILKFIHPQNIIHRDIKPSNVVRCQKTGKLYLIDFGAVKQVIKKVEEGASESATVIMTPGFSPPEQINAGIVYFASDLYSLAATCIYLFTGDNPMNLGIPYNLEWHNSVKVRPELVKIINKMLEPSPKYRYQSADEVMAALYDARLVLNPDATVKKPWLYAGFGIFGVVAIAFITYIVYLVIQAPPLPDNYFTRGEESLLTEGITSTNPDCLAAHAKKQAGMTDFSLGKFKKAQQNFQEAMNLFKKAALDNITSVKCSVDPETLIFLNNAKANDSTQPPLTIAVVNPINGTSVEFSRLSEQILRGVAHLQNKFNQKKGINEQLLQVIIARDDNTPLIATRVAKHIAENKIPGDEAFNGNILAVIGNFTSDAILAADKVYESEKLVAISPTSTAVRQKTITPSGYQFKLSKYVFRIAPSDAVASSDLFEYIQKNFPGEKAAIFYNSGKIYSKSLKEGLESNFTPENVFSCDLGKITISECDSQMKKANLLMLSLGSGEATSRGLSAIQLNNNKHLFAGDSFYSDDKLTPDFAEKAKNMILAIPFDIELTPQWYKNESIQLWETRYVGWRSATAHDAAQVIADALQRLGNNPTRQGLYDVLSNKYFQSTPGATGIVEFDELRDRKVKSEDNNRLGVLVQVKNQCKPEDQVHYRFCRIDP